MSRFLRLTPSVGLVLLAACGGGTEPKSKSATYRVVLSAAPTDLGVVMVSIGDANQKTATFTTARALPSASQSGAAPIRAILVGPNVGGQIAQIVYDVAPATTPAVTVLEAAANASGQYRTIPPSVVQVSVEKLK